MISDDLEKELLSLSKYNLRDGLLIKLQNTINNLLNTYRTIFKQETYKRTKTEIHGPYTNKENYEKIKLLFHALDPDKKYQISLSFTKFNNGSKNKGPIFKIVNDMNLSINPQLDSIEIELYNDYHSVVGLRIARRLNPKKEETIYTTLSQEIELTKKERTFQKEVFDKSFLYKRLKEISNEIAGYKEQYKEQSKQFEDIMKKMLKDGGKFDSITQEFTDIQLSAEQASTPYRICVDKFEIGEGLDMNTLQREDPYNVVYDSIIEFVGIVRSATFALKTLVTLNDSLIITSMMKKIQALCTISELKEEDCMPIKKLLSKFVQNTRENQDNILTKYIPRIEQFLSLDLHQKKSWQFLYDSLTDKDGKLGIGNIEDVLKEKEGEIVELSRQIKDLEDRQYYSLATNKVCVKIPLTLISILKHFIYDLPKDFLKNACESLRLMRNSSIHFFREIILSFHQLFKLIYNQTIGSADLAPVTEKFTLSTEARVPVVNPNENIAAPSPT